MRQAHNVSIQHPQLDLDSIRDTLQYVLSDTRGASFLHGVTAALETALAELETVQAGATGPDTRQFRVVGFVPRDPVVALRDRDTGSIDGASSGADERSQNAVKSPSRGFGDLAAIQQAIADYFKGRKS